MILMHSEWVTSERSCGKKTELKPANWLCTCNVCASGNKK